ncbi:hypothetical protein ACFO3J_30405 [Streptomyces polygonati]|uniref:Uncharacterized protein n=1 Tax=Streptomyces polygonati TaxID=1617087 RepID=A0ABV8HVL8_9ACTN
MSRFFRDAMTSGRVKFVFSAILVGVLLSGAAIASACPPGHRQPHHPKPTPVATRSPHPTSIPTPAKKRVRTEGSEDVAIGWDERRHLATFTATWKITAPADSAFLTLARTRLDLHTSSSIVLPHEVGICVDDDCSRSYFVLRATAFNVDQKSPGDPVTITARRVLQKKVTLPLKGGYYGDRLIPMLIAPQKMSGINTYKGSADVFDDPERFPPKLPCLPYDDWSVRISVPKGGDWHFTTVYKKAPQKKESEDDWDHRPPSSQSPTSVLYAFPDAGGCATSSYVRLSVLHDTTVKPLLYPSKPVWRRELVFFLFLLGWGTIFWSVARAMNAARGEGTDSTSQASPWKKGVVSLAAVVAPCLLYVLHYRWHPAKGSTGFVLGMVIDLLALGFPLLLIWLEERRRSRDEAAARTRSRRWLPSMAAASAVLLLWAASSNTRYIPSNIAFQRGDAASAVITGLLVNLFLYPAYARERALAVLSVSDAEHSSWLRKWGEEMVRMDMRAHLDKTAPNSLASGSLSYDNYERLQNHLNSPPEGATSQELRQRATRALGSSGGGSLWKNVGFGAGITFIAGLPLALTVYYLLREGTFLARATMPTWQIAYELLVPTFHWAVYGFVYSWTYTWMRGATPLRKALSLGLVVVLAETVPLVVATLSPQWTGVTAGGRDWLLIAVTAVQALSICLLLGLLWEVRLARAADMPWRRLHAGRTLPWVSLRAATFLLAIVSTLATTTAEDWADNWSQHAPASSSKHS